LEAAAQAAEVGHQAADQVDERTGAPQAPAEAEGADAPAAAEPEARVFAQFLEEFGPHEEPGVVHREELL
ncbi:hypothetical protein, partial [Salmonella enterica]|uniref:hypothetical protein n=1 Tax=Salmonella enterica TaxID=28901 RepID=UPI0032974EAB